MGKILIIRGLTASSGNTVPGAGGGSNNDNSDNNDNNNNDINNPGTGGGNTGGGNTPTYVIPEGYTSLSWIAEGNRAHANQLNLTAGTEVKAVDPNFYNIYKYAIGVDANWHYWYSDDPYNQKDVVLNRDANHIQIARLDNSDDIDLDYLTGNLVVKFP